MRKIAFALTVACCLGCPSKRSAEQPRQAQSQRARDSTIGASKVPGAAGVRGALRASDSAAARAAQIDSAGREP